MRDINEIIVHCTATRPDWWQGRTTEEKVAEIKLWHTRDRKWKNIGYHYLIDRDGTVAKGRPVEQVGAHCKGHNTGTIGVALFGGHGSSENDKFSDHYTVEQNRALRELLADLSDTYGIKKITGHNLYAAKACPGFDVPRWLARKPAAPERTSKAQSTTLQAAAGAATAGAGGVATVLGSLDPVAQYIVLGAAAVAGLCILWIIRERIKAWGEGRR